MAEYIDRDAFLADKKWLYCTDCDKRKGKKRGKMVTLYEIGEAPCKSCGIHDILEEVEDYPAADVRPVVRGKWIPDYDYAEYDYDGSTPLAEPRKFQDGWQCSFCGGYMPSETNFCPNCGAWMEES
jgi:hypothetical protein